MKKIIFILFFLQCGIGIALANTQTPATNITSTIGADYSKCLNINVDTNVQQALNDIDTCFGEDKMVYPGAGIAVSTGSGWTTSISTNYYYLASNPNNYIPLTSLSSSMNGLTYNNSTGVFSLTSGYYFPLTTDQSNWNNKQSNLNLLAGSYTNGDVCTYTSSGTLLNCNTAPTSLGLVNSVSNSDGTITISPNTGSVVASLNLAHSNTWTQKQILDYLALAGNNAALNNILTSIDSSGDANWETPNTMLTTGVNWNAFPVPANGINWNAIQGLSNATINWPGTNMTGLNWVSSSLITTFQLGSDYYVDGAPTSCTVPDWRPGNTGGNATWTDQTACAFYTAVNWACTNSNNAALHFSAKQYSTSAELDEPDGTGTQGVCHGSGPVISQVGLYGAGSGYSTRGQYTDGTGIIETGTHNYLFYSSGANLVNLHIQGIAFHGNKNVQTTAWIAGPFTGSKIDDISVDGAVGTAWGNNMGSAQGYIQSAGADIGDLWANDPYSTNSNVNSVLATFATPDICSGVPTWGDTACSGGSTTPVLLQTCNTSGENPGSGSSACGGRYLQSAVNLYELGNTIEISHNDGAACTDPGLYQAIMTPVSPTGFYTISGVTVAHAAQSCPSTVNFYAPDSSPTTNGWVLNVSDNNVKSVNVANYGNNLYGWGNPSSCTIPTTTTATITFSSSYGTFYVGEPLFIPTGTLTGSCGSDGLNGNATLTVSGWNSGTGVLSLTSGTTLTVLTSTSTTSTIGVVDFRWGCGMQLEGGTYSFIHPDAQPCGFRATGPVQILNDDADSSMGWEGLIDAQVNVIGGRGTWQGGLYNYLGGGTYGVKGFLLDNGSTNSSFSNLTVGNLQSSGGYESFVNLTTDCINGGCAGFSPSPGLTLHNVQRFDTGTFVSDLISITPSNASTSAQMLTGVPYSSGSGTTNFPLLYLDAGTGPSTFSTGGTELGFNAPSGFTGNFIDAHVNGGSSVFSLSYNGNVTTPLIAGSTTANGVLTLEGNTATSGNTSTNANTNIYVGNSASTLAISIANSGISTLAGINWTNLQNISSSTAGVNWNNLQFNNVGINWTTYHDLGAQTTNWYDISLITNYVNATNSGAVPNNTAAGTITGIKESIGNVAFSPADQFISDTGTLTDTSGTVTGDSLVSLLAPSATTSADFRTFTVSSQFDANSTSKNFATVEGLYAEVREDNSFGTATSASGVYGQVVFGSSAGAFTTLTNAYGGDFIGVNAFASSPTGGTVTTATSVKAEANTAGNITLTGSVGLDVQKQLNGTNNTDILYGATTTIPATGNWGIYQGSDAYKNYFSGATTVAAALTDTGEISGGTKFTTSGCSVSATTGGSTAGTYTSGTSGTCTVVITMNGATGLTAPTGWSCRATDFTTALDAAGQLQTASSTTTATISGTTVSGDVVSFSCQGY